MIRSMEGFTLASVLDLNMGYYHIKLVHEAVTQQLCTIVFPWHMEKYRYKRVSMDIKIALDEIQIIMSKLVQDMQYVKTYLDNLLTLTNISFKEYLLKL
jgi:hypothetical protein